MGAGAAEGGSAMSIPEIKIANDKASSCGKRSKSKLYNQSHDAVIRGYDEFGAVIERCARVSGRFQRVANGLIFAVNLLDGVSDRRAAS